MLCECNSDEKHHVMSNPPWEKPGKGGQYCTVPMCSCIQFTPVQEDFFSEDVVTKVSLQEADEWS